MGTKGAAEQKQTSLEDGFIYAIPRAHGNSVGPNTSNRVCEATKYKVSGGKCSLMCIDSLRTKRHKQSLAVWSARIPLPEYLDNMHPCDSWKKKNNGPMCVYSLSEGPVCVKSSLTNGIVFTRKLA